MVDVAGNYRKIIHHVFEAAAKAGRDGTKIKLLAAAKSQSIDALRTAVAAGVTLVGENYVQEAKEKRQQIKATVEWHMIGHLQRNKTKAAVEVFDVIQSLDNVALARELDKAGRRCGKHIRALVEVNLGGEESKTGIDRNGVTGLLQEIAELSNLRIEGLMTVPPFQNDLEEVRPYFRDLRELKENLDVRNLPNIELKELSMGMTHDYTVAIEEGATIVRIGTALFGPRSL